MYNYVIEKKMMMVMIVVIIILNANVRLSGIFIIAIACR